MSIHSEAMISLVALQIHQDTPSGDDPFDTINTKSVRVLKAETVKILSQVAAKKSYSLLN